MIIDELITLLKFDVDKLDKAEAYKKVVEEIETVAKATSLSIGGLLLSVGYLTKEVAESTSENSEWAQSVGVATDTFQKMEHAVNTIGGSIDDVKGDMEMWARAAGASGEKIEDIFLREAGAVENLSNEQSYALLRQKGYSDKSIRLIQLGRTELSKMFDETQIVSEKNLRASTELLMSWRSTYDQVKKSLVAGISEAMPSLQHVVKGISEFIDNNKELIATHIGAFFKSVAFVVQGLGAVLTPIIFIIGKILTLTDKLTFGLAKYAVIIPALTALFTAWGIAMSIQAYTGIVKLIASTGFYLGKIGALASALKTMLIIERSSAALKAGEVGINQVLITQEMRRNTSLIALIAWKIKDIAVTVWHKAVTLASAAAAVVATLATGGYNASLIAASVALTTGIATAITWVATLAISTATIIANTVATWAATAATWALNAAMYANPAVWIVAAIVGAIALVAGGVYLIIKYWNQIVDGLVTGYDWLMKIANWLKTSDSSWAKMLKYLTMFLVPLTAIYFYWEEIGKAFKTVINLFQNGLAKIGAALKNMFSGKTFSELLLEGFDLVYIKLFGLGPILGKSLISSFSSVVNWISGLPFVKTLLKMVGMMPRGGANAENNQSTQVYGAGGRSVTATPGQVNNSTSNRNVVINNNNTINTSAQNGPAIANYLKNVNPLQGAGYGVVGTS